MRRGGEKKSLGNGGINVYVNTLLENISGRKGQKNKKEKKSNRSNRRRGETRGGEHADFCVSGFYVISSRVCDLVNIYMINVSKGKEGRMSG